jgi:MYXO-CTERM domain-containing protein
MRRLFSRQIPGGRHSSREVQVMRRLFPLLLGAAAALGAPSADAYVPTGSKWKSLPVTYKINQASIPPSIQSTGVASIEAGFASWMAPSCTSFQAVNQGNTSSQNTAQDQQNTILWRSGSWPGQLGSVNSTIGVTLTSFSGTTNIDADIVFNNVGFSWNNSGNGNNVDTESIAVHEQGHFLGLDHTPPQSAIMYAAYTGGIKRTLSGDDTQGVCALYPCTSGDCGTGGSSGAGGTGSGGTGGGTGQTCGQCQEQVLQPGGTCSQASSACSSSPSCTGFIECLQACSTQTCVNQCVQNNPQGVTLYNNVVECICGDGCDTECAADCGGGQGGSGGSGGSGGGSSTTPTCNVPSTPPSAGACVAGQFACNPVTNEGCPAGSACDFTDNGFGCYEPPNDATLCGGCSNQNGPFCQGGLTCAGSQCAKFCCDDSDCGGATCDKSAFGANAPVGLCFGTGSGAGGSGGSGAGGTNPGTGGTNPGAGGTNPGTGGTNPGTGGTNPGTGGTSTAGTSSGTAGTDPGTAGTDPGTAGSDPGTAGSSPEGQGGTSAQGGAGASNQGGQSASPLGNGESSDAGGCGCRTTPAPGGGAAGLLPLLLGALLRRRRR